ncbi:glutathione peroxidase [Mrakia frigida]|uniref:glutathione peroxidase n=1 Tax=Mrakia frigida TaxID=29902 RepID=UPI003FCC1847
MLLRHLSRIRPADDFYSLKADLPGKGNKVLNFQDLRGKVVLIVNTASKCGFTGQYTYLETLHKKYSPLGLEIIGFPCDQFGGQEPGSDEEIASFCTLNHGVTFPLAKKSDVNGSKTNPVFAYLFLVSRDGQVKGRYAPTTKPENLEVVIERLLDEPSSSL